MPEQTSASTHQISQCNVGYTVQTPVKEMSGHLQQLLCKFISKLMSTLAF